MATLRLGIFPLMSAALLAFCGTAHAGAGFTSGGVTTTGGTNSTDPSSDVQSQSSNFVQQNQQLQNTNTGANGGTTGVVSLPGGKTLATDPNAASQGKPGDADAKNADGKSGTPGQPGQAAAAPAVPPPPPPDYVSVVKHLNKPAAGTASTTVVAANATAEPAPAEPPKPAPDTTPPPPRTPPVQAAPRVNRVAEADKHPAEHPAPPPAVSGGSGAAPDGYTFYVGLGLAGLLLGFAGITYVRGDRDESLRT
jgi:hypothetical protein